MVVLVTGASGFLGGALTKALVQQRYGVRVFARKSSILHHLRNLPIDIAYGDLENKDSLTRALKDVKIVYHCAGFSTDWGPWNAYRRTNILGLRNILQVANAKESLKRFVHLSSTDVYGYPELPADESYPITDNGLPYNRSKALGEKAVWKHYKENGLPVTIIRPASIYGPRSKDLVVEIARLLLAKQMLLINHGTSPGGFLYVDNAVEGIIQASLSQRTIGRAYNLRDETTETWNQYVTTLAKGIGTACPRFNLPAVLAYKLALIFERVYLGLRIRKRPLLTRHAVHLLSNDQSFPIEKAQKDFGFESKISFSAGMDKTIAWLNSEEGRVALTGRI